MRMFRLPSWISESRGCDQVLDGEVKYNMANAGLYECASPTKRKRSSSPNAPIPILTNTPSTTTTTTTTTTSQEVKRRKREMSEQGCRSPSSAEDVVMTDNQEQVVDLGLVRETIESQLSLEILMKHNELRLIETELAKCQVSLEQLRRAHLIPFPGMQGAEAEASSESMVNVSTGTGPAVWSGDKVPKWAPPYGITEGPYTRHWAKWLIPDPAFDGIDIVDSRAGPGRPRAGKSIPEGRATRNSIAEGGNVSSKSRSRGSHSLQSLSTGHIQPKKSGPCILKRSDGKTVKLVCLDCNREDFSSTQGFINHCRIAHRREFKSHEEAAQTSGHVIEVDEAGAAPVLEKSPSAPPTRDPVHPLVKSAPVDKEAYTALRSRIEDSMNLYLQGRLPGVTSIPGSATSSPQKQPVVKPKVQPPRENFKPSTATPHLSELLKSRGFGGDLHEIVGDAKTRIDMDEILASEEESSDDEVTEESTAAIPSRRPGGFDGSVDTPMTGMRIPARATMSPAYFGRPTSSKGMEASGRPGQAHISPRLTFTTLNTSMPVSETRNNRPQPINTRDHDHDGDTDMGIPDTSSIIDLSPNTVVSNNAPSLVSDDGEYDEGDDDAESVSSGDADEGSDVAEIDIEDGDTEKVVRGAALGRSQDRNKKDDKHVTFVREVPDANGTNKKVRPRQG
ncbi:uncharacterized protein EAF02_011087 [Botrytis sinoallii]|uniref:uncharacterized protein n=1 Tax=Botrytis sinoallii TaxID=1463999 RepID=UPI0019028C1E|nr:uncharacterized protein EAF02_011087 [Botrytis sinoallii]KAF7858763.1 hypothetical protein EAF02_011087 [Botrytis sinoallii]